MLDVLENPKFFMEEISMDASHESMIVKSFFTKRVQERVQQELSSPKKRLTALNRLCHRYEDTLVKEYLIEIPEPNSDYMDIFHLLQQEGAEDDCYAISFCEKIDGQHLPLLDALKKAVGFGLPSLISCIPNQLAYFESEQEFGPPKRFIIKKP